MVGRSILAALFFSLLAVSARAQQGSQPSNAAKPSAQGNDSAARHPIPLSEPEAEFPAQARLKLHSGSCVISMTVNTGGIPQSLHVVSCSDTIFAASSLAAAEKYRFKPAADANGSPVAASLSVEIDFQITPTAESTSEQGTDALRIGFATPPGVTSFAPDAQGVYPLSKQMTAPTVAHFADSGLSGKLFASRGKLTCDLVLTIDGKGRASDAGSAHCDQPDLEAPVIASLLKSRFSPGRLEGKAVPVRVSVHLVYDGAAPKL
jgi:TonB family protein